MKKEVKASQQHKLELALQNPSFKKLYNQLSKKYDVKKVFEDFLEIVLEAHETSSRVVPSLFEILVEAASLSPKVDIAFIQTLGYPKKGKGKLFGYLSWQQTFSQSSAKKQGFNPKPKYLLHFSKFIQKESRRQLYPPHFLNQLIRCFNREQKSFFKSVDQKATVLNEESTSWVDFMNKWVSQRKSGPSGGAPKKDAPSLLAYVLAEYFRELTGNPHHSLVGRLLFYTFPSFMKERLIGNRANTTKCFTSTRFNEVARNLYKEGKKKKFKKAYSEAYSAYKKDPSISL